MKKFTKQKIGSLLLFVSPVFIYLILSFAFVIIFKLIQAMPKISSLFSDEIVDNNSLLSVIDTFSMGLTALFCYFLVKHYKKISIKNSVNLTNFNVWIVIIFVFFTWGLGVVVDNFCGFMLADFITVSPNRSVSVSVFNVIRAVILLPIFEEFIFRYAGTEFLRDVYKMPVLCIINALLFAVLHFYNIQGFFNVFVGGLFATYVYYKTENILYTIVQHAVHNALCLIPFSKLSLFGSSVYYEKNGFVLNSAWWIIMNLAFVIFSVICYYKVYRKKYVKK